MIDSFEKLADICIKNKLGAETVDYLVDIKKAFELACFELEEKDYKLFDLYDLYIDTYYENKDRLEWRRELLERAKEDE